MEFIRADDSDEEEILDLNYTPITNSTPKITNQTDINTIDLTRDSDNDELALQVLTLNNSILTLEQELGNEIKNFKTTGGITAA